MKLSHKLMMVSTAALIGASPVISASQPLLVHAANKASQKGTIKLSHNAYVFDKNGKRLKTYMGSAANTKIGKGQTLKYKGKTTIGKKDYYDLGGGAFVKAANVGFVDGKKVVKATTATAKITHNAYIYNAKGKTAKKKVKKGKTVTFDQATYIGKKLYYRISGQTNQFIKAANVGKITGAKLKPVNSKPVKDDGPADNQNDPTVITLSHNAYIFDGAG
ncbi:cell division protein, partial [Lactobacillus sp. XV13L]|nr:cell division protein [Lactobacillus sp. XV13L]